MPLQNLPCVTRLIWLLFMAIGLWGTDPTRGAANDNGVNLDVEIDPIAYALHGYSLHVGLDIGHLRYDLGVYAADVPRWLQGNSGFDTSERGVGIKAQYFLNDGRTRWFLGASFGPVREHIEDRATGERVSRDLYGAGVEAGYRIELGKGFYAKPWLGLDYLPRASDLLVAGQRYTEKQLQPFAAIHLGILF